MPPVATMGNPDRDRDCGRGLLRGMGPRSAEWPPLGPILTGLGGAVALVAVVNAIQSIASEGITVFHPQRAAPRQGQGSGGEDEGLG